MLLDGGEMEELETTQGEKRWILLTLDGVTEVEENMGLGVTIMGDDDVTGDVVLEIEDRRPR